jgi:hypothetical protein
MILNASYANRRPIYSKLTVSSGRGQQSIDHLCPTFDNYSMSGWLAVAEKLFGRPAGELPTSYTIECACGRQMSGTRGTAEQVTFCAACGTALFVLPHSVYPRPRGMPVEPAAPSPPASQPQRRRVANPAGAPRETAPKTRRPPDDVPTQPRRGEPSALQGDPVLERTPKFNAARLRRKLLSPVRLVLMGVAVVTGLTVWWSIRVSARNEAERILVSSVKLAQQALDENDLGGAAQRFQEVQKALDTLGRTDSRARELRQTTAEITASADLVRSSLYDILNEAVGTTARSGATMWEDVFRSSYRDEWVLIDAHVTRTADASSGQKFEIEYPLSTATERVMVVGDLECFERAVPGGSPRRVIFAAQLGDFSHVPRGEAAWQIVLRPATAFLWSAPEHLERLGIEIDEETKQVLADQSSLLGMYQ